jgi:hypothetical protein
VPVSSPASDGVSGAGQVDNAAQLASFESGLANTLPQTISDSIAAGFQNQAAVQQPLAEGEHTPFSDELAGFAAFTAALAPVFRGTGGGGEQNGGAKHGKGKGHGKAHTHGHSKSHHTPRPHSPSSHRPGHHKPAHHHHPTPHRPTGRGHKRHG